MVALALKRHLGINYASVDYRGGRLLADGKLVGLFLPLAVRNRIKFSGPFSFCSALELRADHLGVPDWKDLQVQAAAKRALHIFIIWNVLVRGPVRSLDPPDGPGSALSSLYDA